MKSKLLVTGILCCIAVSGFVVSTFNSDHNSIVDMFKTTTDGSYYKKYLTVNSDGSSVDGTDKDNEVGEGEIYWNGEYTGAFMTTDPQALELIEKVKKADCSDQRKVVAIWALAHVGDPNSPYVWGGRHSAAYRTAESGGMDCSSFVAWCQYNGGNDLGIFTTAEMANMAEHQTLEEMIAGGDIHIGDAVVTAGSGHTAICVYIENGVIYFCHEPSSGHLIELGNTQSYLAFRKGWHKLSDAPASRRGGSSDTGSSRPGSIEKIRVQDPTGCMLPETEFTKYTTSASRKNITVMVDPGHVDPNIRSKVPNFSEGNYFSPRGGLYNGETEEDFAQAVGDKVRDKLLAKGFDVIMSRDDSTALTPNKLRAKMASEQADLHVCIHWNGSESHTADGTVLMVPRDYDSRPWKAQIEEIWATCAQGLSQHLGSRIRSNCAAGLAVFGVDRDTPVLYIETGFADGPNDGPKLVGESNHEAIAEAIANGIIAYYEKGN